MRRALFRQILSSQSAKRSVAAADYVCRPGAKAIPLARWRLISLQTRHLQLAHVAQAALILHILTNAQRQRLHQLAAI